MTIALLCAIVQWAWGWDGSGTSEAPYLLSSSADWQTLAADVSGGNDYAGVVFRMTNDIDAEGVMVGDEGKPFSGTIDGDNHVLTFNKGTSGSPVTTPCAPFHTVSGATLRHLNTEGTIYTNAKFAAGIVSRVSGSTGTTLTNCHSAITISSAVNGDGTHGGLVAVVSEKTGELLIENCSFKGKLVNTGKNTTTNCGGFVGWSYVPVTVTNGFFTPDNSGIYGFLDRINSGANFVRMSDENMAAGKVKLTDCYATVFMSLNTNYPQGTFLFDQIYADPDCICEILSDPEFIMNGKRYYKSGVYVKLIAPADRGFNHWEDTYGHSFISDPWRRTGTFQLKDVHDTPLITYKTEAIPSPITERTLWGVKYRYLSRKDYHYYVSDEDCRAMGWTFRNGDSDANLIKRDGSGNESLITAVVGYDESNYNSDGVQIHNDLVSNFRDHTHLGIIAPRAFKDSKKLTSLYFKDTDATLYNALLPFQFIISDAAFEGCTNFKELKMMQYTTKGGNHWEALKPDQVYHVADNAFDGCPDLRISVHNQQYQNYLSSETWNAHHSRFIIYEATTEDFTVEGVRYHYYRKADETGALKNDNDGRAEMMNQIRTWNADYQQFNVADLLDAKDGKNVYYCYIIGVDNSKLDSKDGVMRIYNDPGSTYNYKNIALGRNAIAGNTHVKAIEFWQTNGDLENSYSDLKMVIPNGALKDCKNLKELRMFYYMEDGDDRWAALGPKDVIPGDNIFGLEDIKESELNEDYDFESKPSVPEDFRILVSTDLYPEFLEDPNWQPYLGFIEPEDYLPSEKDDFNYQGLTYSYMTSPGGILQTSQVVSQDVSWWTAPRIAVEVALMIGTLGASLGTSSAAEISGLKAAENAAFASYEQAGEVLVEQEGLEAFMKTTSAALQRAGTSTNRLINVFASLSGRRLSEFGIQNQSLIDFLNLCKIINQEGVFVTSVEKLQSLPRNLVAAAGKFFTSDFSVATAKQSALVATKKAALELAKQEFLAKQQKWLLALAKNRMLALTRKVLPAIAATTSTAGFITSQCWGGTGSYNADAMNKGMRQNILSNIHQVGLVGGGYLITTPQKNIVYHTYIKSIGNDVKDAVIFAGFDNDHNVNTSNRTMTFAKNAFRDKTNLKTIKFHENPNKQTSNTGMPLLFTIPDSAFVGCSNLTEFSTLMETRTQGETRSLGPENFILAGDSIFAGKWSQAEVDSLTAIGKGDGLVPFHIVVDPKRKQDFLDNESWAPLEKYFVYKSAVPAAKYNEYGAQYAYAYEQNSIKKEHKEQGHLIEHTTVIGPDETFLKKYQGAVKLCNDIGIYNNYQLDGVMPEAFKDCQLLRSVTFTDLKGRAFFGDVYTGLQMHIGDRAFENCTNMADIAMLYMVTDGLNHIDPITPQQVTIGKNVFDGTKARIKMMPQQMAWFEADSAWAAYKDRFQPCIIKVADEGVKQALKDMTFYDAANTGLDQANWSDYIDYARIAGKGFKWLDGRFTAQKDKLRSFADFRWFESVGLNYVGASWFDGCSNLSNIVLPSTIANIENDAFKGCSALTEIEIPAGVETIGGDAFTGCTNLNTIIVRGKEPAYITLKTFDAHDGLKIYVPTDKVETYKQNWKGYAQYIFGMDSYHVNKVVTTTAVGQLAQKLGITMTKQSGKVRYLNGPYAKYDSLTVSGPLNGEDLAVIRHLAGADAYDSNPTDGQLRYLNLWNANIKKDTDNSYNGNFDDEYIDYDNKVGDYLFENCAMIETVILPKSATFIGENVFEDTRDLKRVCVGLNTTGYDTDLLQNLDGIEELALITNQHAHNDSFWSDPWEADIEQVWTLPSQMSNYLGDTKLTKRAHNISAPLENENVILALAEHGYYFPTDYMQMESAEGIFNDNLSITDLSDFRLFMGVKHLENTFGGMNQLETIRLPYSIETIDATAFSNCNSLSSIYISCDSVPVLAEDAFVDLPADFQILVPKNLCKLYRTKWAQYADHINPDASFDSNDDIITVTLTEANTLAEQLGLKQTLTDKTALYGGRFVINLSGDYSHIRRLKVVGPISGADLDVLDYLAGYCKWAKSTNYSGHLEYLDLYDAQLKETDVWSRGYSKNFITGYMLEQIQLFKVLDNTLPQHALLRASSLNTLILPKTCKQVNERALQECDGLETLVIGDDMEDFNWNALDDDAMLTRMYILAKKKVKISKEWPIWRLMCNNYNPTFDAFYVVPSLYEDYLKDDAYTGSSWQRTNNISRGEFTDDDSFRFFASHAAATYDDLLSVTNINGWADSHPNVKDLTALGLTSVSELPAADIQKLTKLEIITLPANVTTLEAGIFSQAPNLRYVNALLADDDLVATFSSQGFTSFGIDSLQTLVYVPSQYTGEQGTNIVVGKDGVFHATTFRLVDGRDYCVPYAFEADKVENSRVLAVSAVPYTVCLPYGMAKPEYSRVYRLSDRNGSTLTFAELPANEQMEALQPYLVKAVGNKRLRKTQVSLDCSSEQTIPTSSNTFGQQHDTSGYSLRGTLNTISNAEAAELGAYILQSDGNWHRVSKAKEQAQVLPFRAFLLPSARNANASISMTLIDDDATGIDTIETIDNDGTHRYYDLNGREVDANQRGIIISNGKKIINK